MKALPKLKVRRQRVREPIRHCTPLPNGPQFYAIQRLGDVQGMDGIMVRVSWSRRFDLADPGNDVIAQLGKVNSSTYLYYWDDRYWLQGFSMRDNVVWSQNGQTVLYQVEADLDNCPLWNDTTAQ